MSDPAAQRREGLPRPPVREEVETSKGTPASGET